MFPTLPVADPPAAGAALAVSAPERADAEIAALFKALAHPARIQLARFLSTQETCYFGSLADRLPQSSSTVSQHITQMKDGGLIKAPESGDRGCYCLDREAVARLKAFVASL
jgi:ArsR family transcriptional regulator